MHHRYIKPTICFYLSFVKISPCRFDESLLFCICYRCFAIEFSPHFTGLDLNAGKLFSSDSNDIYLAATYSEITMKDIIAQIFKILTDIIFTYITDTTAAYFVFHNTFSGSSVYVSGFHRTYRASHNAV